MENITTLAKMKSGNAAMGETQFLPGYCILFAEPKVPDLNDLSMQQRADFLLDMGLLGDAIMMVCNPIRVNYAILCNNHPYLHAHLYPRFGWELDECKVKNVWLYPEECWTSKEYQFHENKHGEMKTRLAETLKILMDKVY